jgi:hypothetical protein
MLALLRQRPLGGVCLPKGIAAEGLEAAAAAAAA